MDSAWAISDTGYAGLDQGVGPVSPDIDHGRAVADNDPFCSLEEAVFDSDRAVFPRPRGVHKECDTVPARPRDPAGSLEGSVAEGYWLWLQRWSNERQGPEWLLLVWAQLQARVDGFS